MTVVMKPMRSLHLKAQGKARAGTWTGMSGAFDAEVKVAIGGNSQEGMKVLVKAGKTTVRNHDPHERDLLAKEVLEKSTCQQVWLPSGFKVSCQRQT